MTPSSPLRPLAASDLPALKGVIEAVGLFPCAMLDEMCAPFLGGGPTAEFWLTYDDGAPVGLACCAPERMTAGTWNLLLIAVSPERQGRGIGAAITRRVERKLAADGERLLLVETSGLDAFEGTRAFYRRMGFEAEARIRDFYGPGEDKIVFRKELGAPGGANGAAEANKR